MNELIVIEPTNTLPTVPDSWDYNTSVEKTKTFFYKWKNLTDDIKEELWIAREKLSVSPQEARLVSRNESSMIRTWSDYCEELGTSRQVVNRWLEKAYSSKEITVPNQPEFDEDIETDNECPSCGYEW